MSPLQQKKALHSGHTMLELVAAGVLLAVTLVPALRMMRDGMTISSQIENRGLMTMFCVSKLDEGLALAAANWASGTFTGSFVADGYAQLRYRTVTSDAVAAGGIVGRLMSVTTTVWQDTNGNAVHDSGESSVVYASKIANMAVYQDDKVTP